MTEDKVRHFSLIACIHEMIHLKHLKLLYVLSDVVLNCQRNVKAMKAHNSFKNLQVHTETNLKSKPYKLQKHISYKTAWVSSVTHTCIKNEPHIAKTTTPFSNLMLLTFVFCILVCKEDYTLNNLIKWAQRYHSFGTIAC